uniref:SLPTX5 n=1 Tax=Scolopendra viridis TaxID=118503 RepID=A0A4D5R9M1_SCOVI
MQSSSIIILFGTVVLLSFTSSTYALKCIMCDAPSPQYNCKDSYPKEAMECPPNANNYCFKRETFDTKGELAQVRRMCNPIAAPSEACHNSGTIKICEYSCNTDGCNSVAGLRPSHAAYFIAIVSLMFYTILRM